jgi:hypothetical protein
VGQPGTCGCSAHLKRLRIPLGNLFDRRHLVEPVGKGVEFLHPVREANWQLFGEELGGPKEGSWQAGQGQQDGGRAAGNSGVVPADGLSPNWTIWRRLTPVAGKFA